MYHSIEIIEKSPNKKKVRENLFSLYRDLKKIKKNNRNIKDLVGNSDTSKLPS